MVSHDRDFLSGLTDELYEFRDGAVHEFKGDIMEFLAASQSSQSATVGGISGTSGSNGSDTKNKTATAGKQAYEQSKERERERRKLQSVVSQKEKEIEAIESEIAARDEILSSGAAQTPEFYKEYQSLKDRLEQKMKEWEDAVIAAEQ